MLASSTSPVAVRALSALASRAGRGLAAPFAVAGTRHFGKVCFSDRSTKTLHNRTGDVVPTTDAFWEYVADEQSVADAPKYENNTENYIGTVKYPVGLIGPLKINGEHAKREYHVPMATHEGALLASYSRGAKAITSAGGCTVRIKGRSMLRAPVFLFKNVEKATDFYRYVNSEETKAKLISYLEANINHCKITTLRIIQTDRKVHISIGIDSDAAAGQNKVTYAGDLVMRAMEEWYTEDIPEAYIEGGFNAGKRVSVLHSLLGKGHSIVIDCVVPKDVCEKVLHCDPYQLQRFQKMHNRTNEFMGGISCTAHVANGLAAFYIANGQDPACVAESQAAVTHFDLWRDSPDTPASEGSLYASMTLNSVIVAMVGGGVNLPAFKAARDVTGITDVNELAEVCAAVALSGELSFYAAMASGEFTAAHWNMTHK